MDWLLLQPLIFAMFLTCVVGKSICLFDECAEKYHEAMQREGFEDPVSDERFCRILKAYTECLEETRSACRGDLIYHGNYVLTKKKLTKEYCTKSASGGSLTTNPHKSDDYPRKEDAITSPPPSCRYYGSNKFRHCSLFGDPHLKTFDGLYQTCRVSGKWLLIDNSYMSVEVTNEQVLSGSSATAPTKISVVVKGQNTPCTLQKTYEAKSNGALATTFTDGSVRSGPDRTVVLKVDENSIEGRESVEIVMMYIASKLIIRKVGKYLAFSAKLPEEVIKSSRVYNSQETQLCVAGCPLEQQLDISQNRGYLVDKDEAFRRCTDTNDLSYDINNNLTDNYLDWCVFDVMTAGVKYDFIAAVHTAQADALKLDPSSLKNRTTLLPFNSIHDSFNNNDVNAAHISKIPIYFIYFILLYNAFYFLPFLSTSHLVSHL